MNNQFYRNNNNNPIQQIIKKQSFPSVRTIFLLMLIPIIFFMLFNTKGVWTRYSLKADQKTLEEKIKIAEETNKFLLKEIDALKTDKNKIEKIAREKYNMKKPGETIYKRKIDKN
jgi:cell division protein FtsB